MALDPAGQPSTAVLSLAYLNAQFQTGLTNSLDGAIQGYAQKAGLKADAEKKIDEIPYDFVRKRLQRLEPDELDDEPGHQHLENQAARSHVDIGMGGLNNGQ